MSKLSWQAIEAKRLVARAAVQMALAKMDEAAVTGGACSGNTTYYQRALYLVREAERALTLSERR